MVRRRVVRTARDALFPIGERRLPATELVVVRRVPEQKVEPAEDAAGDGDEASKKQQSLQHGPLSHAGA
jgi:hypothetical protein